MYNTLAWIVMSPVVLLSVFTIGAQFYIFGGK